VTFERVRERWTHIPTSRLRAQFWVGVAMVATGVAVVVDDPSWGSYVYVALASIEVVTASVRLVFRQRAFSQA
jgi:hypothetical protein